VKPIATCISYPKSGRTWLRYMLLQLIHEDDIKYHHDGFEFNDGALPAHNFDLDARLKKYSQGQKLVYLDRDPRDVMVSLFHQVTGRFSDFFNYGGTLSDFLRDDYFGALNLKKFREMWFTVLVNRPFLHISYEQLHRNPVLVLDRVVKYLELDVSLTNIVTAVSAGDIKKMKSLELSADFSEPWLRPRNGHTKVRKGEVGGFRSELCEQDIDYLNSIFAMTDKFD